MSPAGDSACSGNASPNQESVMKARLDRLFVLRPLVNAKFSTTLSGRGSQVFLASDL